MAKKNNSKNNSRGAVSSKKTDLAAQKKAAVLGAPKKKTISTWIVVGCIALAVAGFAAYMAVGSPNNRVSVAATPASAVQGDSVSYAVADFDSGKAMHYSFQGSNGIAIRYFIIKSSDGIIRAAFDACDVCWRSNKGYKQDGDFMVCNNCGRRFASVKVNEVQGGCNPAPLERSVENGRVVIRTAAIVEGSRFFNFSS
jgi:uncharacterized membrane protein